MRKSQREIKNFDEIIAVLDKCPTIRLGINGDPYPYVVPLSFGYEAADGKLTVYFHCAKEGRKLDMLSENGKVCIEADILNGYVHTEHGVTADYESVIAVGQAREVSGEEAVKGLELLLKHCSVTGYSARDCVMRGITAVYAIDVETVTGKKRFV